MATLPAVLPVVAGYSTAVYFKPASLTGGDTCDLALVDGRPLVVMADAAGHGIAPALSVTQMHAMLRMAFRRGASLQLAICNDARRPGTRLRVPHRVEHCAGRRP